MNNKLNLNAVIGGNYLYRLRCKYELRLIDVADGIGISVNYLSEIENGKRVPRDEFIRKFNEYYGIDEVILFDKFGRVSLSIVEELRKDVGLHRRVWELVKGEGKQVIKCRQHKRYKDVQVSIVDKFYIKLMLKILFDVYKFILIYLGYYKYILRCDQSMIKV